MFHSVSMPTPVPESESVELVLVGWDGGVRVAVRLLRVGEPGWRRQQRRSCVQTTLMCKHGVSGSFVDYILHLDPDPGCMPNLDPDPGKYHLF